MKTLPLIAVALVLATTATAQERAAGQAYDAQVNWASLKGMFDKVDAQNKALATTLDKMMACNNTGKLFSPAAPGADSNGCAAVGGTAAWSRGAELAKPLVMAGFDANTGSAPHWTAFPAPFKTGTVPIVVLNRNYTPGGDDTDNYACNVTNLGFYTCGDAKQWKGNSGETTDTVFGHKWIAVGEAPN